MAKIRLIVLFLVGLTIVAVTLTRLLMNLVLFNRAGQSHDVANVELFFEAFVANAPTIYGLLHIERRQQSKLEGHSYSPGAWTESKSATGEVRTVMSRVTELNRRNTRHGDESDEEMMIVGIAFSYVFRIYKHCEALSYETQIGIIGKLQQSRFTYYRQIRGIADYPLLWESQNGYS